MKKKITYYKGREKAEREINYIPVRYIIAGMITLLEVLTIIGIVVALCYFVPYFYIAAYVTAFAVELKIISSDDNPDYKVPWMLFVLVLPIAGFMLYFIFAKRKLQKKYIKRLKSIEEVAYPKDREKRFNALKEEDELAYTHARQLTEIADTALFSNTDIRYFPTGEEYFESLLSDIKTANKFIYMEYFIIEEGHFWNSILEVLKSKAKDGVEVKVLYDDIGCMSTLPGNYPKILAKSGIEALPFSRLKGNADSEFNNRSHRKITVIDGAVGYTGGINIADEYINKVERFGHWKDVGIRLSGDAVYELTRLFICDYGINVKRLPRLREDLFPTTELNKNNGYVIPFGDGPKPIYKWRVGKSVIQNLFNYAKRYVYVTTPYLIIDNDLCQCIENAALRGVDVRIIVPHIPDKKIVFGMTRSFYHRLMDAGVRIYEYEPGFIHAKTYLCDDAYSMVGTINLDYRSLVHHFENGVWLFKTECIKDIKQDIEYTLEKSVEIKQEMLKTGLITRLFRSVVRIFAPML